jgi:hypothetical protein
MARVMPSRSPTPPINATVSEVHERLQRRLLRVRSVWFPTPRELREWQETQAPLYLCWLGPERFEIGPRLVSMWASCFCPVFRGSIESIDSGARLSWTRAWPRFTIGLLVTWAVTLVLSLGAMLPQVLSGQEPVIWLAFWGLLAGGAVAGPLLGGRYGGAALDERVDWLIEAASNPIVEEDW